jgi:iron complex transport system substrate-binding protein
MRIASLLPSATEIVSALGLGDQLIGISHECDYPPEVVAELPRLTHSAIPPGLTAAQIDAAVSERLRRGESLYLLDEARLGELRPDLIITQELCDVCAVGFDEVCAVSARLPGKPRVLSLAPPRLSGIFENVRAVADAAGVSGRGEQLIAQLQGRLDRVARRAEARPRVLALEWLDPPFAAGHWVPEMIALAGGIEVLGRAGEKSFRITWEQVIAARAEVLLLIPCGYSAGAAQREWEALPKPSGLESIPALQTGRVYALDANSYCSRPGPRVVDGVESIARLLHPDVAPP